MTDASPEVADASPAVAVRVLVRVLDGADPTTAALLLPVLQAVMAADVTRFPEPDDAYMSWTLRDRAQSKSVVLVGFDASEAVVGFGRISLPQESDTAMARGVLWVHPARRREHFGTALLASLRAEAAGHGRNRLLIEAPEHAAGLAFAERHGGTVVFTGLRSVLDLARVDRARFTAWAAPGGNGRDNSAYRSVRWVDRCPEELVESYARSRSAMDDAPHSGLGLDSRPVDTAIVRVREAAYVAAGMRIHTVAAIAPDGSVAGYTEILDYPGDMRLGGVGDTAVVAAHRGHGLGLRLKAEMTLWVLDEMRQLAVLQTWNATANEPMLRVNRALGYEATNLWNTYQFGV